MYNNGEWQLDMDAAKEATQHQAVFEQSVSVTSDILACFFMSHLKSDFFMCKSKMLIKMKHVNCSFCDLGGKNVPQIL